jgi:nucleotidyltransferase/DNA polymerase involved in DNA repair
MRRILHIDMDAFFGVVKGRIKDETDLTCSIGWEGKLMGT